MALGGWDSIFTRGTQHPRTSCLSMCWGVEDSVVSAGNVRVFDADQAYLAWLRAHPQGCVLNTERGFSNSITQWGRGPAKKHPTRFYGSQDMDPMRISRDARKVVEEEFEHLESVPGAKLKVTLEIEADIAVGVPENIVRIVQENCAALKFRQHGFE